MKRFIKIFSLVVLFIAGFFSFFLLKARANFAESFSEVVDSLRGVEEEAVTDFHATHPESVDGIILGNRGVRSAHCRGRVVRIKPISQFHTLDNCDDEFNWTRT